jgi:hypothetical protein
MVEIGETISKEQFNNLYSIGTTISGDEFNKKYGKTDTQSVLSSPLSIFTGVLKNMPKSTWDFASNIVKALNPISNIKNIVSNVGQIPSEVKGYMKESKRAGWSPTKAISEYHKTGGEVLYKGLVPKSTQQIINGDLEGAAETIVNDPVGQIAPYLLLAKYGFDKAGKGELFDKAIQTIASPVTKPTEWAVEKLVQAIGKTGTTLGGLTTGKGSTSIEEAYKRTPEYQRAIKGETTPKNVVDMAKGAIENIKEQRRNEYLKNLDEIPTKGKLDITEIKSELKNQLDRFRIVIDKKGNLDFSKSSIRNDSKAVGGIKTVYEDIMNWKDLSPRGIDSLKQGISQVFPSSASAKSFIATMEKVVGNNLKSQVPEYSKLTESYKEYSSLLNDLKGYSGENPNTIFTKLTSSIRGNNALKEQLIQELQAQGKKNIMGSIAGIQMKQWESGYIRSITAGGFAMAGGFQLSDLLILASTSPRIVSNFLGVLGMTNAQTSKFLNILNGYRDFYGLGIIKQKD